LIFEGRSGSRIIVMLNDTLKRNAKLEARLSNIFGSPVLLDQVI